jgi:hypothetical protein
VPHDQGWLAGFTQRFFDQNWSFGPGVDFGAALGLHHSPEIFALSDVSEKQLKRRARRGWAWSFVLGAWMISGATMLLV